MIRFIEFIFFLYYKYYSTGPTSSVAYIKTVCVMVTVTFIIIYNIFIWTDFQSNLQYFNSNSEGMKFLEFVINTLPLFLFYLILFPEKKVKQMKYPESKIKKGNIYLLIGSILSILSIPITLIIKYR
jgi:hypothetical protein